MNKYLLFYFALIFSYLANAASITSTATGGTYSLTTTWSGGVVPGAGDDVTIAAGATVTVTDNRSCNSLTVNGTTAVSILQINSGKILTITGAVAINAPTTNNITGTIAIGDGVLSCASLTTTNPTTSNTRQCIITVNTGTLTCSGNFTMGNNTSRNFLTFTSNGLLQLGGITNALLNAQFTPSTSTVEYNMAGAQTILALSYYSLKCSNSGAKSLAAATTVTGNLTITGTAQLDVDVTNNYALSVAGNWSVTSTNADPFLDEAGTVTLGGTSGTQIISTVLAGGETFNNFVFTNTSITNPGVQLQQNLKIAGTYSQTITSAGSLDLKGNALNITGAPTTAKTYYFTTGSIITSVSGGSVTVTDINAVKNIYFRGTNFGDATNGVTINCTCSDSYFNGGIFYGTVIFTKNGGTSDDCNGGCTFYGPCTFNTSISGDRWRMGCINPDIFYNATFNHLDTTSGYNFSVARCPGNHFYGTTNIYSAAAGGFFVGRSNNTAAGVGTANFHGPVSLTVTASGNAYFGESDGTTNNATTFESTLQLNSTASSTGDIYIGKGLSTSIIFTNTGQLIDGTIAGATNVYFYGVTQNGTLSQSTTNTAASGSTIYLGSSTTPCTWNGSVTFTAPNINLANSTYNGSTNNFTANGSTNQTCVGGNTFASGTTSNFINNGAGYWRLANTSADNYNGNITYYRASGGGNLSPAYAASCNYAGNITVQAASDSIDFSGGGGAVVFSGTSSASLTNSGSKGISMQNITMNKTGGASFTLNNCVGMPANGSLTLISGLLNTSTSAYLYLMDETCTAPALTDASTSYINGPMRYDMSVSTSTKTLNFPIGVGTDCRPFVLTTRHGASTSYSYMGQVYNSPASMLVDGTGNSWGLPATVDTVSGVHYWTIDRTVTSTSVSASNTNLTYLANKYPLVQFYFGTNDYVYQGANLTIVKNTSAAPTNWIDIGASCALGNFATPQAGSITSTTSGTPFNSFSTFALGSKTSGWNSLPIELLNFTAKPNGEQVDLNWETSTETNNKFFTIERSADGKNFAEITTANSKAINGNSKTALSYQTTDASPLSGTSYYRLKQTDYNGKYKYFNMVSVAFEASKNITFSVYPNPNLGEFTIDFSGIENNHEVQIALRDELGKEVYSNSVYSNSIHSNQVQIIPTSKIAKGKYFCSLIFEGVKRTLVVIVN